MAVLMELIEKQSEQIQIQEKIIESYKKMIDNYDQKVGMLEKLLEIEKKNFEIVEEELRRERSKNETLAQGSDQLSSAAAGDSSVEGAVSDSGASSEGSHA